MNRGGSIRKARKGEYAPCLVASDTSSGIHSEHQRRMAHFYTWSATMYELRSARRRPWWPLASLRSLQRAAPLAPLKRLSPRRCNAMLPLLVMRSMKPRRQACSIGRNASDPGFGGPQQAHRIPKRIFRCPACPCYQKPLDFPSR